MKIQGTNILSKKLLERIDDLALKSLSSEDLAHNGLTGETREFLLEQFLKLYLPLPYSIGSGKIQGECGTLSKETDLIIFDESKTRAVDFSKATSVFPIESVKYAIEVKSTVTSTEIDDTTSKFHVLKNLSITTGSGPKRLLFGFTTNLSKKTDIERIIERDTDSAMDPSIQILCILNKEYGYFVKQLIESPKENRLYETSIWKTHNPDQEYSHLIQLLIGILSTLGDNSFYKYLDFSNVVDTKLYSSYRKILRYKNLLDPGPSKKEKLEIKIHVGVSTTSYQNTDSDALNDTSSKKKTSSSSLINTPNATAEIKNIDISTTTIIDIRFQTSQGLEIFLPADSYPHDNLPFDLEPNAEITLTTGFFTSSPSKDGKGMHRANLSFKQNSIFQVHDEKMTGINVEEVYIRAKVKTSHGNIFYSPITGLQELINDLEVNDIFLMTDTRMCKLLMYKSQPDIEKLEIKGELSDRYPYRR